jgi:hypothetical protein
MEVIQSNSVGYSCKRTRTIILTSLYILLLTLANCTIYAASATTYATYLNLINNSRTNVTWDVAPQPSTQDYPCPSVAYLQKSELQNQLTNDTYLISAIKRIGPKYITYLVNQILWREESYAQQNYGIFYHGQQREFMLLQDLIAQLYQLIYKKPINNFFFLRMFDPDFGKYTDATQFLVDHNYSVNNYGTLEQKVLLSVNPWLWGNSTNGGSCTFTFFLTSSNCTSVYFPDLIKHIFEQFKIEKYYTKYNTELSNLLNLLAAAETRKTGLLMQIFIPKTQVNTVAYRAVSGGTPYYRPTTYIYSYGYGYGSPSVNADQELPTYLQPTYITNNSFSTLDAIQYRLLFTPQTLLDPSSGIVIYRYCNEQTQNMIQYKQDFDELINNIKSDLQAS